jgi:hypothetical protein
MWPKSVPKRAARQLRACLKYCPPGCVSKKVAVEMKPSAASSANIAFTAGAKLEMYVCVSS